jgi:hypothetical protein
MVDKGLSNTNLTKVKSLTIVAKPQNPFLSQIG